MPTEETESSIVDYRPDGTVRVMLSGKAAKLRRPTVGDVWRFQEGLTDTFDEWQDLQDCHRDTVREAAAAVGVDMDPDPLVDAVGKVLGGWAVLVAEMGDEQADERSALLGGWVAEIADSDPQEGDPPPKEWRKTLRELNRANNRQAMGLWFALNRQVFAALSTTTLPDDDEELDPALGSQSLVVALLRHWQTVPLPSGR